MTEIETSYMDQEQELVQKHNTEMETFHAQLEQTIPQKSKPSPTLLNTMRIQQNLAKQKRYAAAYEAQQKAIVLQEQEQEQWNEKRTQKIAAMEAVLISKQKKEKDALDLRVQKVKEELKQQKDAIVKTIMLKHQNARKQIKIKEHKRNIGLNTSRELIKSATSARSLNKSLGSIKKRDTPKATWK